MHEARAGVGTAQSLPWTLELAECAGRCLTAAFPGATTASVLLHPLPRPLLPWYAGVHRAGADGTAHTSPALLQWEDAAAAAGAWEEGEDEEPAL